MTSKVTINSHASSPFALVPKVIPFDVYKHKLTQPFWCEYYEKQGHLREYCRRAIGHLPKYTPIKPDPNSRSSMDKGKAITPSSSTKNEKKENKRGGKEETPKDHSTWVPVKTNALN